MKIDRSNTTGLTEIFIKEESLRIFVSPDKDIETVRKRYAERNIVRVRYNPATGTSNNPDESETKLIDKE